MWPEGEHDEDYWRKIETRETKRAAECHDWRFDKLINTFRCFKCLVRSDKAHGPRCKNENI